MTGYTSESGNAFRVLATCGSFIPGSRGGGPVRSVARIVDTLPGDIGLDLITRDRDLGEATPYPNLSGRWALRGSARVHYLPTRKLSAWLKLLRTLHRRRYDLLYLNSLWEPLFTIIPLFAARIGIIHVRTILLAPRGELSPGALALKARKKKIAIKLLKRMLAQPNVVWQGSSELEGAHIRRIFRSAEVLVNSNQISLPSSSLQPTISASSAVSLVFLGRITRKKNLIAAVQSLGYSGKRPIVFDIYGPIEDAKYFDECMSIAARLPANVSVTYCGEVSHNSVRETFAQYDAFIFPTFGENFGHVIAESLSASCPVLCSDQTPWNDILLSGAGWVLEDTSPKRIGAVIGGIASESAADRFARRSATGQAYEIWHHAFSGQPHVFDALRSMGLPVSS